MRIDQYRTEQFAEAWAYHSNRETQRQHEDGILARAALLTDDEVGLWARHLRECAAQIRDHRANGNYTTMHR